MPKEEFEKWISTHDKSVQKIMRTQISYIKTFEAGSRSRQPEIDTLNERLGLCEITLDNRNENVSALMETNSALKAEVERLRADAERYRWLRDPCVDIRPIVKYQRGDYGWGLLTHQSLDEVIDAAMKETK